MDISWDDAKLFLAVAEAKSLSGAARALQLGQPTVTRRLALLEYQVGAVLFHRAVTGVSLTSAGERLVAPAQKMAEWAAEFERAAEAHTGAPQGLVRVTAAPFYCAEVVVPFAAKLTAAYPLLRLEVLSSVQYLDLSRGEAHVALRGKAPVGDDLKLIAQYPVVPRVFVAPKLKARLPKRPKLNDVPFVAWSHPHQSVPPNPQLEAAIPGFQAAFTADHFLVQLAAAEAGLGAIILAPLRKTWPASSPLVPLELDLGASSHSTLYLVSAKSAYDIPRVRVVVEAMASLLADGAV
jgi:DNA-binding transcriptional LysR family regulator